MRLAPFRRHLFANRRRGTGRQSSKRVHDGEPMLSTAIRCHLLLTNDTHCECAQRFAGVYFEWRQLWPPRTLPMSSAH